MLFLIDLVFQNMKVVERNFLRRCIHQSLGLLNLLFLMDLMMELVEGLVWVLLVAIFPSKDLLEILTLSIMCQGPVDNHLYSFQMWIT